MGLDASLLISLNPTLQYACYPYAVHQIAPGQTVHEKLSCLMVWRNAGFLVQFSSLHLATYVLLDYLSAVSSEGTAGFVATFSASALASELSKALPSSVDAHSVMQELLRLQNLEVLAFTPITALT